MNKNTHLAGMACIFLFALFAMFAAPGKAASADRKALFTPSGHQSGIPPQSRLPAGYTPVASYTIDAHLDDQARTITGRQVFSYTNVTSQPIPDLVFHLYLNAFRSADTIFMRESGFDPRGFSWDSQHPGWIEVDSLRLSGGTSLVLELMEDGTLARANLPNPVAPGETVELVAEFRSQLPRVFARTGFAFDAAGDPFFMVAQWFPKLGVWQDGAWNAYPFHANAEFYADFGTYDVSLTLPVRYTTGATGRLVSQQEHAGGTRTDRYQADGVIDFAWTASPNFLSATRRVGEVELRYLYLPEHAWTAGRVLEAGGESVTSFGEWYGPYPYPELTIVDVPDQGESAGGMEYPNLVAAGSTDVTGLGMELGRFGLARMHEVVVVHEISHQWWQSVVAFNEAEEPWLDEGFADYSTARLVDRLYGEGSMVDAGIQITYLDMRRLEFLISPEVAMDRRAWEYADLQEYAVASYSKPALSLLTLEGVLGEERMLSLMSTFFQRHQFAHPTTADFRLAAEEVSGQNLSWFFEGLVQGGMSLDYSVDSIEEHRVTVVRRGELAIPTEIRVKFEDGSTVTEAWNGATTPQTFAYLDRPPVVEAEVDPERKIVVDLYWTNNGLARRANLSAWIALVTRLLYQFQNVLLAWGGI